MARTITPEAFEELYRSVAPELFGYLRRQRAAEPEDLVAETFAIAWRRRDDLPAALLRRAWLFGTARRLLLAAGRQAVGERAAVTELRRRPVPGEPADSCGDSAVVVRRALARLTPDDRELIELVEWERLTPAEVAVALGIKPGTARVRLHRARQALAADPEMRALVVRADEGALA